jgi:hypothetical protein
MLLWDRWADWSTNRATDAAKAPAATAGDAGASDPTGPGGAVEQGGETGSAHPLASLSLDKLHDTVRRPLFEKKRRPLEPPPRTAPAPAPPPSIPKRTADPNALTLLGVLTSDGPPGTGAIALMRRNQTGQTVRLQEGDTVDGWTIERIESARVHLRQGDIKLALELFRRR